MVWLGTFFNVQNICHPYDIVPGGSLNLEKDTITLDHNQNLNFIHMNFKLLRASNKTTSSQ